MSTPRLGARVRLPCQPCEVRPAKQAIELPADHAVALTTGRFESGTVEHLDEAALILDQPRLLEVARHGRDTGTPDAQHHRQKLLRERKRGAAHAVVGL